MRALRAREGKVDVRCRHHIAAAQALPPIVDGATSQAVVDRVEIEALRGDFTDAVMMRDDDRVHRPPRRTFARVEAPQRDDRPSAGGVLRDPRGLRTVRGLFGAYDGSLTVRAGDAAGELLIEARSLDTGNNRRDQHLTLVGLLRRRATSADRVHDDRRRRAGWPRDGHRGAGDRLLVGATRDPGEGRAPGGRRAAPRRQDDRRPSCSRPGLEQAGDDPRRRHAARPAHAQASPISA